MNNSANLFGRQTALWLLAIVLSFVSCLSANAIILGNKNESLERHTAIVISGGVFCTGVIISSTEIITAASCIKDIGSSFVLFKNANKLHVSIESKDVIVHPGYVPDALLRRVRSIDLAILKFKTSIPGGYLPVDIFRGDVPEGAPLTVGGYGTTKEADKASSGIFSSTSLNQIDPYGKSTILFWLASRDEAGACTGDAGGPVVFGDKLVGIIVWAEGDKNKGTRCGKLTQAVRLSSQTNWLDRSLTLVPKKEEQSKATITYGSSFKINEKDMVTNFHVVRSCKDIQVGEHKGKLIASDESADLAIIRLENMDTSYALIRLRSAKLNETVFVAGFPLKGMLDGIAVTGGNVSRLSGLGGNSSMLQISAPIQPGNSGGPLLDTSGYVIGVASSKLNALKVAEQTGDIPQNINFAINAGRLKDFLVANNIGFQEPRYEKAVDPTELAESAKLFTRPVVCTN